LKIDTKDDKNLNINQIIGVISDKNDKSEVVDKFMQKIKFKTKCRHLFIFRQYLNLMPIPNQHDE
jgi:hypothetical protein